MSFLSSAVRAWRQGLRGAPLRRSTRLSAARQRHLFHLQRNQSSSFVPQMAWAFFDKVSSAAASASAFSFLRSSFSNARLFLRSAAKSDLLDGADSAGSDASKAAFHASMCSGYKP